jgi:hypothetical protein
MHDANALSGLPLCSALVLMQLVQRVRPSAVLGACAYAACAAYAASAACDCARVPCHKKHKTKGVRVSLCRRTGPKESIPRHPITPFTNTGLLLGLFAGLWLGHRVGITVCVIMYIMCSISSTHCDRTPSCSCAFLILVLLFSTDLAPLNRAFNPCTLGLNYPNALTDLGPNQTNAPQNALKMPAHCAQKCAQNTNTIRAPNTFQNAFENAFECPPLLLTLASAAPPRTAAAPARPRSPPRSWRPRRRML